MGGVQVIAGWHDAAGAVGATDLDHEARWKELASELAMVMRCKRERVDWVGQVEVDSSGMGICTPRLTPYADAAQTSERWTEDGEREQAMGNWRRV